MKNIKNLFLLALASLSLASCEGKNVTSNPIKLLSTVVQPEVDTTDYSTPAYEMVNVRAIQNATWTWETGRNNEQLDFKNNRETNTLDVSFDRETVGEWACIQIFFNDGAYIENKKFSIDLTVVSGNLENLLFDVREKNPDEVQNDKKYARKVELNKESNISFSLSITEYSDIDYMLIFINEPNSGEYDVNRPKTYPANLGSERRTGRVKLSIKSARLEVDDLPHNPDDDMLNIHLDGPMTDFSSSFYNITKTADPLSYKVEWDSSIEGKNWDGFTCRYDVDMFPEDGQGHKCNTIILDYELVKGKQIELFVKWYDNCPLNNAFGYGGKKTLTLTTPSKVPFGELSLVPNSPYNWDKLGEYGECELIISNFRFSYVEVDDADIKDETEPEFEGHPGVTGISVESWMNNRNVSIIEQNDGYVVTWDTSLSSATNNDEFIISYDITSLTDANRFFIKFSLETGDQKYFYIRFNRDSKSNQEVTYANGIGFAKVPLGSPKTGMINILMNSQWDFAGLTKGECKLVIEKIGFYKSNATK